MSTTGQACLDDILLEIGDFGKYQLRTICLISLASAIAYIPIFIWVFETKQLNYRCEITGCETDPIEYTPLWWADAIPSIENKPAKCEKYKVVNSSDNLKCIFDKNVTESCDKFIYETTEISILRDLNLHCSENEWKLTIVGTVSSMGLFISLPISGIISDRFGRKTVLIYSMTLSALMGLARSFSNSYTFFIIMVFVDSLCRAIAYPTCVILGVELVGPSKRGLVNVVISIFCSVIAAAGGGLAWILHNWRTLDQIVYGTTSIILLYYWLIPESIRWLLTKEKYTAVENILQKISNTNGTALSQASLQKLWNSNKLCNNNKISPLRELVKSSRLIKRLVTCSACWICCLFSYHGLTVSSVALSKNNYLDFMLTSLADVPGCIAAYLLMNRIGRRKCLAIGFFISCISCVGFIFIPEDLSWLKLSVFLFGKCTASMNLTVIYTLTSEIFPTTLRGFLLSVCSMLGRIGAMTAPQTALLTQQWQPLALFSAASIVGVGLSLLLPETMDIILPDTVQEVEREDKK